VALLRGVAAWAAKLHLIELHVNRMQRIGRQRPVVREQIQLAILAGLFSRRNMSGVIALLPPPIQEGRSPPQRFARVDPRWQHRIKDNPSQKSKDSQKLRMSG
jgi:hypothetical protein